MLTSSAYSNSPIITLVVGREARIFAAHEEVLTKSPVLAAALRSQYMESTGKRLTLPDEEPEVLSPILEYLYKGDYSPRLVHNKRRDTWEIESNDEATIFHQATGAEILKDTVIYCAAEKYKLDELKRIALRKQGLRKCFIPTHPVIFSVAAFTSLLTFRPTRHRHPLRHHPVLGPLRLRQHVRL
jgi:hypothetical protein